MKIDHLHNAGFQPEYNPAGKQQFKLACLSALREVAQELDLRTVKPYIRYNAGGIAVSGEVTLHDMLTPDVGVYIQISMLFGKVNIMYRKVKGLKDYTGGINRYMQPGQSERMITEIKSWV